MSLNLCIWNGELTTDNRCPICGGRLREVRKVVLPAYSADSTAVVREKEMPDDDLDNGTILICDCGFEYQEKKK
ncbi:MAG: hypothetical protein JW941_06660 [Candidatus Coatesbacteria bacterium]|nr:hypothetical protein [Candidatus Coatesbacteria bacterium]